ncbi:MAG TPA: DUF1552 domain-containing protein [Verrucomicrobiae bacterium]|nr:DUF1552 domain-containing protein [Verrucomicrobiae bacterium]
MNRSNPRSVPRGGSAAGFSRRAVLRGAGCALALPWLESLHAFGDTPEPANFPKRFGVVFLGNGINEDCWSATGSGAGMVLSKTLQPLEPLKQKINVIDGLFVKALTGQGIHPAQTGSLLSGAHISKGAIIHSGISIDQMIANRFGAETPQSSIVLACDQPMTGYHETNFSLAYSSHISWQTPDSPVPVEIYPSLAWDNLFDNRGSQQNISILDRVRGRAEELSRRIASADKTKLDEFLASVREVETRVEGARAGKASADDAARRLNTIAAAMERPANGLPEDLRDHARLMCDIIALAFQTGQTRVASLIISRDLSAMYYPFLNVKDGHHAASHANNTDGYERIARFHVEQFTYLASKLDAMKEGEGSVLDNTCLMFLSNLWIGRKHDNMRLPLILAGGLGGTLETGRCLDYLNEAEDNRKMCSLYLSLMDRFGLKLESFGDASERLERL